MKRTAILGLAVLALAWAAPAQQQQPAQNPPAGPQGATATPSAGAQAATPAAPQGKRPPQAKTQPEFDAYKAAATATDAAAQEKAADDFATKFPDSELRVLLYTNAMRSYQSANNGDKMMEMGRKVLKIDPDNPEASVGVAEVLAERTRDTDIDKDQRLDEAMKLAQHAVETANNESSLPAGLTPDKVEMYKGFVRSSAYSIIGTLNFNKDKFADAEAAFRKSIEALPSQPDPVVVLRLALSLDKQEKYADALNYAGQAAGLSPENSPAGNIARKECDRVAQLAKMPKPASCGTGAPQAAPK
jgi:tetratricopeptide (TPR) repeat protein